MNSNGLVTVFHLKKLKTNKKQDMNDSFYCLTLFMNTTRDVRDSNLSLILSKVSEAEFTNRSGRETLLNLK